MAAGRRGAKSQVQLIGLRRVVQERRVKRGEVTSCPEQCRNQMLRRYRALAIDPLTALLRPSFQTFLSFRYPRCT